MKVWNLSSQAASSYCVNFKVYAFVFLKTGNDLKKVTGLRISLWPKHPHQAFWRSFGCCPKGIKSDSGVDKITQNSFAGIHISG